MALDLTCLQTRKANRRSRSSSRVGARWVTVRRSSGPIRPASRDWARKPPETLRKAVSGLGRVGEAGGEEEAEVLLAGEDGLGGFVGVGGDDDFGEDGGDLGGGGFVEGAVEGDDAAVGADRVAAQGEVPGVGEGGGGGDAAGVGVLDDDHGGLVELGDALEGGVGVVEVVIAEFLALELAGGGDSGTVGGDVEGGLLVGVFAVAEGLAARAGEGHAGRERGFAGEPGGDGGVVGGGAGVGGGGEAGALLGGRAAAGEGFDQVGVLSGVGEDDDVVGVLGGGADESWAADVDLLDAVRRRGA